MRTVKPKGRLFIGSSSEAIEAVNELNFLLDRDAWVTPWDLLFDPSDTTLQRLCSTVGDFDFGVFVFSPDDVTRIRKKSYSAVRDNVLFELGLFIGRLGQKRNFIVMPRGVQDFRLPTDLLGVTPVTYEPKRPDKDLRAALNAAAQQIRTVMRRLGPMKRQPRKSGKAFQRGVKKLIGAGLPVPGVRMPKTKKPPTKKHTATKRKVRISTKH